LIKTLLRRIGKHEIYLFNKNEEIKKRNTQVDKKGNNDTKNKYEFHDKFEEDKRLYVSAL
jgi:hypothetical protein